MEILAIDVGGTFVKYACISDKRIRNKGSIPTPIDDYQGLLSVIDGIVRRADIRIEGIAVSLPGVIDTLRDEIISGGALTYLKGSSLKFDLENRYGLPVLIENDAKAAIYAESDSGALMDVRDGIILVLGTGVGMGMKINGSPFRGSHFQAGEVSFLIMNDLDHTEQTLAGSKLSSVRLIHGLAEELQMSPDDGGTIFERLAQGTRAYGIFSEYTQKLAILIFNLFTILDFEKVVIGGGISRQSMLIEQVRQSFTQVMELLHPDGHPSFIPSVSAAGYGPEANLMGAALLLENVIKGEKSNVS